MRVVSDFEERQEDIVEDLLKVLEEFVQLKDIAIRIERNNKSIDSIKASWIRIVDE
jgi:hypothetical protein